LGITLLQAHRYDAAQAPLDRPTLFSQTASSAHATPSIWAIWRSPAGRWTKLNATTRKLWPWPAALLTFY
jgi:hypothetical protein